MIANNSVVFRVDASPEIGLGHLRRCLTLADHLRNTGRKVCLVCRDWLGPEIAVLAEPHVVYLLDKGSRIPGGTRPIGEDLWDADATLSLIGQNQAECSWVVVDSYRLGHRWERRVRNAGFRVMAIDDFRDRMHHADLLVSDLEVPFDPALNEQSDLVRTLVGREYALIGPEYAYSRAPDPRSGGPRQLLISYGGSDATGETIKAIMAIRLVQGYPGASRLLGRIDVVVGQLNPLAHEISQSAKGIRDLAIHMAPPNLAMLMQATDLFLTAGGNSMLEALSLRKPCLVTVTGANQKFMVNYLAAEKIIRSLGAERAVTPKGIADAVVGILTGYEDIAAYIASRPLFDHLGAQRIAAEMLNGQAVATR